MNQLHLKILCDNQNDWIAHATYETAQKNEDSGLDIPMPETVTVPAKSIGFMVDLGIKTEANWGYMLLPRSSISKTPLRLANSVGIIDKAYRGKLMVKLDNLSDTDFTLEKGKYYFQIIAYNGILPTFTIVETLSETLRNEGGFGSTTK